MEKIIDIELEPQTPPFTILVEPTEGCNVGCSFCGLQGMKYHGRSPLHFMTLKTAQRIADEVRRIGWRGKVVFANHGEPILNPQFVDIVRVFRSRLPKTIIHMFTNGKAFSDVGVAASNDWIKILFEAGIDDILWDCYTNNSLDFIHCIDHDNTVMLQPGVPFYTARHERRILIIPPLQKDSKNWSTRRLSNHAGAAFPLDKTFNNRRCAMPFREIVFRYNGWVNLCCDDFRGAYRIANINDTKIEDIWNHERFQAARIMLYNHDRRFIPCDGCTNISTRVGLLPDVTGKKTLPPITTTVRNVVQQVFKRDGYLADLIIKRPWE